MSEDRWWHARERGAPLAVAFMRWAALSLGRRTARSLLYPITAYFYLTAPDVRRASRRFLARVRGHQASWWEVAVHIHTFSATILDRTYFLAGRHDVFDVAVHGAAGIDELLRGGRGCVMAGAHVGSFEALRAVAVQQRHLPVKVLMHHDQNGTLQRILDAINEEVARTIIPLGRSDSMLAAGHALQTGHLVGMLADRVDGSAKVTCCRLLGGDVMLPAGAVHLAALFGVPLVFCVCLYRGGNRYEIFFERLAEHIPGDRYRREEETRKWMQAYANRLEHYVRLAPYNWFNFYDYWHEA
jgi:predicted LPLAT superfamily acyltransferase